MADSLTAPTDADDANFANEGDTVYDKNGAAYVIKNGQPTPVGSVPSALEDMKNSTLPGLYQGLLAVKTAPASIADLAATGVGKAAQYIPPFPGVPEGTADFVTNAAQQSSAALEPYTYGPELSEATKIAPELGYEAQTFPGKVVENAGRALPAIGLTGGESALPTISRTLGSALGSTSAGALTNDNPWAQMAGALIGYGGAPTGLPAAATPRAAMANTLEQAGVPVSAAERTGSRVRATLEGQSPGDRTSQITDQMLSQGGIVRPTGNTEPISGLITKRGRDLGAQADDLISNTSLPINNKLWSDIGYLDLRHTASGTGTATGNPTSLIDPNVHQAYEDFHNLVSGTRLLTGKQYRDLSEQWGSSDNPTIRQMGNLLDNEMEKAHPEWSKWNEDWANYKGLKAASDAAGGTGTTNGLDPSVVRSTIYKPTGLKKFAEAAEGITGSYPKPYSTSGLDTIAALGGLGYGAAHGGFAAGSEDALPGMLGIVTNALKLAQPAARSRIGQKYLMLDPKSAAAALYGQGPGPPAAQPNGGTQ
jgi:hypothetical protein